jgi:hypothetical protein
MLSHEDLWIKISNDFHAEINPILEQLDNTSKQSFFGLIRKVFPANFLLSTICYCR